MLVRPFKKSHRTRHEPDVSRDAVIVDYRIGGPVGDARASIGLPHIDDFYDRAGYLSKLSDGLLLHIGGSLGDSLVYINAWESESAARESWRQKRDVIEDVLRDAGPDTTVQRRGSKLHKLVLGDDLEEFRDGNAILDPECVGYVIDLPEADTKTYDLIIEQMDFPRDFPRGLLVHAAGQVDDVLRVVTVWRRSSQSLRFLENRLMPATVEVVREHGVFPEIRPLEMKVHYLAVTGRLLE